MEPRVRQRITVMIFIGEFLEEIELCQPGCEAIIKASRALQKSTKLHKLMEIMLASGNYLNINRAQIDGFNVGSLYTLLDLKSKRDLSSKSITTAKKSTSLLQYICALIDDKFPEYSRFYRSFTK